jgi:hypothetical protein
MWLDLAAIKHLRDMDLSRTSIPGMRPGSGRVTIILRNNKNSFEKRS